MYKLDTKVKTIEVKERDLKTPVISTMVPLLQDLDNEKLSELDT